MQKRIDLLENGCKSGLSVLVPMCGKTVDLHWLCARGHAVTGVELSPIAVHQIFTDNSIPFEVTGMLTLWRDCASVLFYWYYYARLQSLSAT